MQVNICLIGLGYMGRIHLEKLLNMEDVKVSAVVDIDKKKGHEILNSCNIPFICDYRDTFKICNDIQGVIISTPSDTHYEIATFFIERGVHVFIEKPMTNNIKDAISVAKLAEKKGTTLQVGHLERFNPAFKNAIAYINEPLIIEARREGPYTGRSTDIDVVFDLMIHDIDLMLSIIKEDHECRVTSFGLKVLNKSLDIATAIIEFRNGCKGILHANRVSSKKERVFNVFERERTIYTDLLNGHVTIIKKNHKNELETIEYKTGKIDSVKEELKEFVNAISKRISPTVKVSDGFKAIRIAELIRTSIER
ncbi:MAG: Gfo/Idh/MocA family oxidoreductase [Syntrophorhabdaceae bacterium]|nr:Gfo/Idh/MocA family oxidoreductase [Syntrophorhabdaceae bacterium]